MRLQLICLIALAGALYSSAAQAQQTVVVPNLNCRVTLVRELFGNVYAGPI